MLERFAHPEFINALLTVTALSTAAAVLSVFVISRQWAFIGEGISHSGFGGAGTIWLLALIFPALNDPAAPYIGVVVFCLATGLGIGWLSREGRINSDAAIGIFLVASLAWGFLAQQVYLHVTHGNPPAWTTILFGHIGTISLEYTVLTIVVCAAVILTVAVLHKEIIYFCFDPTMAETSGVRAGFIHYLLMVLLAMTIIIGVRVAGSLLVTATLILPGATAVLLSTRLRTVMALSILFGLGGALSGVLVHQVWLFVPTGPAIVLTLFLVFLLAYLGTKFRRG